MIYAHAIRMQAFIIFTAIKIAGNIACSTNCIIFLSILIKINLYSFKSSTNISIYHTSASTNASKSPALSRKILKPSSCGSKFRSPISKTISHALLVY